MREEKIALLKKSALRGRQGLHSFVEITLLSSSIMCPVHCTEKKCFGKVACEISSDFSKLELGKTKLLLKLGTVGPKTIKKTIFLVPKSKHPMFKKCVLKVIKHLIFAT